MSPSPAHLNPRDAADDPEPTGKPAAVHGGDETIFELVPPPPTVEAAPSIPPPEDKPYRPSPSGRSVHPIGITDLSRMAVDTEGRLYWDDKPVEVRRRILMSRAQIIATTIVSAFLIVGAIGAAIQGSAAALDLACRFGMARSYCVSPDSAPPPRVRPDIPA